MEARDYVLALKGLNLTQIQISDGTGIPQPTISKIERGDVSDVMSRSYRALQSFYERKRSEAPDQSHATPPTNQAQAASTASV